MKLKERTKKYLTRKKVELREIELSIIISTLNEEKYIKRTLKSLKNQLKKGDEIIIVDSYSKDNTIKIAKKYTNKIFSMKPQGIGPAKTFGAKKAKNEIVAFLDADGFPKKDWLKRIRKHFSEKEVNAVAGLDLFSTRIPTKRYVYNSYSKFVLSLGKVFYYFNSLSWIPVNNCAIRKNILLKYKGFRGVVCEDVDFGRRAKHLKGIIYDKKLVVYLSDRRFKENGFLDTLLEWGDADIRAIRGKPILNKNYIAFR